MIVVMGAPVVYPLNTPERISTMITVVVEGFPED